MAYISRILGNWVIYIIIVITIYYHILYIPLLLLMGYISASHYCYNGDVMDYIYPKTAFLWSGLFSSLRIAVSLGYTQFVGKTQIGIYVYYI